jgi:hypothetical protein
MKELAIIRPVLRPIIANIDNVVCKKCAYFREHRGSSGLCTKFGEKNIINGVITYQFANVSRTNSDLCSTRGLYYVAK